MSEVPQFDPDKKKILFFSRGRGRGHAIPDVQIADEILARRDDIDILWFPINPRRADDE